MGLEAETSCIHVGKSIKVKALLESAELILRGGLKRRFPLTSLSHVKADSGHLSFEVGGENYVLNLGKDRAATWAKKIATPPPTLAKKLGLSATTQAFVIGDVSDAVLQSALKGHRSSTLSLAAMVISVVLDEAQLAAALKIHERSKIPLWLANVKGPMSGLGENAIRNFMRERGFIDTKTCAVSATLSATRYNISRRHPREGGDPA